MQPHERQRDYAATTASSGPSELSLLRSRPRSRGKIKIDAPAEYRIVVEVAYRRRLGVRSRPLRSHLRLQRQAVVPRRRTSGATTSTSHHEVDAALRRRRISAQLRAQAARNRKAKRSCTISTIRVDAIRIEGPLDKSALGRRRQNYARFFPDGPPPDRGPERDAYAREGTRPIRHAGLPPAGR